MFVTVKNNVLIPVATGLHFIYKNFLSAAFGHTCRFHPPCSDYSHQAVIKYGFFKGGWLALKRLAKCHPFCEGGFDYVP